MKCPYCDRAFAFDAKLRICAVCRGGEQDWRLSARLREMVMERDGDRCRWCRAWFDLTIDHITPTIDGGTNSLSNLQVLCRRCNSLKSDRVLVEAVGGDEIVDPHLDPERVARRLARRERDAQ